MPKFSVVIAVYNKEKYIASTLQSVLDQTYTDFEIVIVNDGSTDNSESEIFNFDDTRIRYFKQENTGAAKGRNTAIQKSKGEYIALLDADDIWHENYLFSQNESIKKFPEKKVYATALQILEHNKARRRNYSILIEEGETKIFEYFEASFLESILHSSSTVIKKDAFNSIGFYNPSIKSGQDTDLYVRIGLNFKIVFLNTVLATYRKVENSLFKTSLNVSDKPTFEEYEKDEITNKNLKIFLDLNRYSHCLMAILSDDKESYDRIYSKIATENLNKKQLFLLKQPSTILSFLFKIKNMLQHFGIRLSSFSS